MRVGSDSEDDSDTAGSTVSSVCRPPEGNEHKIWEWMVGQRRAESSRRGPRPVSSGARGGDRARGVQERGHAKTRSGGKC